MLQFIGTLSCNVVGCFWRIKGWEKELSGGGWAGLRSPQGWILDFQEVDEYVLPAWPWKVGKQQQMAHNAGYYVAKSTQIPKRKYKVNDLFMWLCKRKVEIRIVDNLWSIADEVKASTLNWSLCRMAFAQRRF